MAHCQPARRKIEFNISIYYIFMLSGEEVSSLSLIHLESNLKFDSMYLAKNYKNYSLITISLMLFSCIYSANAQSYSISGNITDFNTGLPIENAIIQISNPTSSEVYVSGITSDAQGNYETVITVGVNNISHDFTLSQKDFEVTSTFPNPVQLNADLNIYYNCPDHSVLVPLLELYDIKGSRIDLNSRLTAGLYSFRLSFQNGTNSNIQKLLILESGYLKCNLIKNNKVNNVTTQKSTYSQLDVKITIEKDGNVTLEAEKSLSSESDNSFDFALASFTTELSPAIRILVLDSIESKLNQMPGDDYEAENQMMLEFLLSLDEIEDVTLAESGSFWASFIDGKIIYIASSRYPLEDDTLTKAAPNNILEPTSNATDYNNYLPSRKPDNLKVDGSGMLPSSKNFRLLDGVGSFYSVTNPIPKLRSMLSIKGYTDAGGEATLESLRNVSGDGIFYFRTHGEEAPAASDLEIYGLWTTSPVDEDAELENAALKEDLAASRIIYMLFQTAWYQQFEGQYSTHYGITHLFIKEHMSFAPNALVYIDACNSSTLGFFRNSFVGASVFIGWDRQALYTQIQTTSQYVFDRLLGANLFDIPDPKQRPFAYTDLPSDPDFGPNQKYGYSRSKRGTIANLGFFSLKDDFTMLAPSIKNFEIDEVNETMDIFGTFGTDPGDGNRTVLIGDRNVVPESWTKDKILVEIQPEDKGDIVVKITDIESNKVPLTDWKGEFIYTYKTFNPTLTQEVNYNLHFRGDVHPYRDLPGNPPQYVKTNIMAARDSEGNWKYSGREDLGDGCGFTEISGAGSLDWVEPGNASEWHGGDCEKSAQAVFRGTIDPKSKTLKSTLAFWVCGTLTFAYRNPVTNACTETNIDEPLITHPDYLMAPLELSMDDTFSISDSYRGESNGDQEVKLEWKNIVTTDPPDENTPSK